MVQRDCQNNCGTTEGLVNVSRTEHVEYIFHEREIKQASENFGTEFHLNLKVMACVIQISKSSQILSK